MRVLAIALLVALLPVGVQGQRTLQIPADMLGALGAIADTATVEHLRCGFYEQVDDSTLVLHRMLAPVVLQTDSASVRAARCPPGTDLQWHNHLVLDPTHRPEWYCLLSPADVGTVLSNPPRLYMVSVSSGIRCWWTSAQVVAALEGNLWPVPGQFVVAKP